VIKGETFGVDMEALLVVGTPVYRTRVGYCRCCLVDASNERIPGTSSGQDVGGDRVCGHLSFAVWPRWVGRGEERPVDALACRCQIQVARRSTRIHCRPSTNLRGRSPDCPDGCDADEIAAGLGISPAMIADLGATWRSDRSADGEDRTRIQFTRPTLAAAVAPGSARRDEPRAEQ
jgi:hypothetical protein